MIKEFINFRADATFNVYPFHFNNKNYNINSMSQTCK